MGNISTLRGGLSNVDLIGSGTIDLNTLSYDVGLSAIITGQSVTDNPDTPDINESDTACAINDKYRAIEWPVRCRSAGLDSTDSSCGIDNRRMEQVLKQLAREEVKSRIDEKLEEELGDKIQGPLKDVIKEGLKGLFN